MASVRPSVGQLNRNDIPSSDPNLVWEGNHERRAGMMVHADGRTDGRRSHGGAAAARLGWTDRQTYPDGRGPLGSPSARRAGRPEVTKGFETDGCRRRWVIPWVRWAAEAAGRRGAGFFVGLLTMTLRGRSRVHSRGQLPSPKGRQTAMDAQLFEDPCLGRVGNPGFMALQYGGAAPDTALGRSSGQIELEVVIVQRLSHVRLSHRKR